MDTPERTRISTPISKFEDSPVFNYINSLSPIKHVKSINFSQTFNSLSFASPPSVFTSPHASSQRESRFLRRQFFSESSKSGLASENGNEGSTCITDVETIQVFNCLRNPPQSLDSETAKELDVPNKNLELTNEIPRASKFECGSPESSSSSLRQFHQEGQLKRCSLFKNGEELQVENQHEQRKEEEVGGDWENLISDAAGLLVFDDSEASKQKDQKLLGPDTSSITSLVPNLAQDSTDDMPKTRPEIQLGSCENGNLGFSATQSGEGLERKETDCTPKEPQQNSQNKQGVESVDTRVVQIDDEVENDCKQNRGTRRRCLLFETTGGHQRKFEDNSHASSSTSNSDDKQFVTLKTGNSSSQSMLPGIGLHLNALAACTNDIRAIKHETLACGRRIIKMSSHITSSHSVVSVQKPLNKTLPLNSIENNMSLAVNEQVVQNVSQPSPFGAREDFSGSCSPKKTSRRLEPASEGSCKRCNCKKSKCLKLYCECFAAGVYCVEPCSCIGCFNKPIHEDTVLATRKQIETRNPLAFAPKVIRSSEPVLEIGEEPSKTPASARHKKGCNCKKSSCLKKYCECFQGGVGCSINCRCESCKNVFGTKDGMIPNGEAGPELEELGTHEKDKMHKTLQISEVNNGKEEHYSDHVPITPFQICRMSVQVEFSTSLGKPPRSSMFQVGSSPRVQASRTLQKSHTLPTPLKLEKHFQTVPEKETPEILRSNSSSSSSMKTSSPKRKRVSPPHGRNTRKLVLQSIPSFPSLIFNDNDEPQ